MIIVKISGGLGNQLFQFATGFCLAKKKNTQLFLDLSWFESQRKRNFELNNLRDHFSIAERSDIDSLRGRTDTFLSRAIRKTKIRLGIGPTSLIMDNPGYLIKSFDEIPNSAYLDGYFQSYLYFNSNRNIVLGAIKPLLRSINVVLPKNLVSIHIRRGDYLNEPNVKLKHGVITNNYYKLAISAIKCKVANCKFIVFSDDPKAQDLIKPLCETDTVDFPRNDHIDDLTLMSKCSHNITANSSFSWWGAWLNENAFKTVIIPSPWYADPRYESIQMSPPEWTRIPSNLH